LSQGTGQEDMPSPTTNTAGLTTTVNLGETYGPPIAAIHLSASSVVAGRDSITLTATDVHDTDGHGHSIIAYRWTSDHNGFLGDRPTVTLDAAFLTPRVHMISLEVQDDEGSWSAPVRASLEVLPGQPVFLPLVVR